MIKVKDILNEFNSQHTVGNVYLRWLYECHGRGLKWRLLTK